MSNPYVELIKLMQGRKRTSGKIVSIDGTTALVATDKGTARYDVSINTHLKTGNTVALRGAQVVGKIKSEDQIKHYIV